MLISVWSYTDAKENRRNLSKPQTKQAKEARKVNLLPGPCLLETGLGHYLCCEDIAIVQ